MIDKEILRRLLELEDLPTLPQVMDRILDAVDSEESSAKDLAEVLEKDHAISARVLRMANSAFYGLRSKVDSIRRAIVVLGFDAVKQLALAASVFDAFSGRKQIALDPEDFWLHSLGAAKATQLMARKCQVVSPEGMFTAGLLHDIGKFVLALALKDEYRTVVEIAERDSRSMHDVERELLKTDHAEVGAWIAQKWRFPELIVNSILYSVKPESYVGNYANDIAVVSLSSDISRLAELGYAGDCDRRGINANVVRSLRFSAEDIVSVAKQLRKMRDEMESFLQMMGSIEGARR